MGKIIETGADMETLNQRQKQQADQGVYRLPEPARAAIRARSDLAQQQREIERQRLAFSAKNGGCEFGLINSPAIP